MRRIHSCTVAYLRTGSTAATPPAAVTAAQQLASLTAQLRRRLADDADTLTEADIAQILSMLRATITDLGFAADQLRTVPVEQDAVAEQPTLDDDVFVSQAAAEPCPPTSVRRALLGEEPTPQIPLTDPATPALPVATEPQAAPMLRPDAGAVADAAAVVDQAALLRVQISSTAVGTLRAADLNQINAALTAAADDLDAISAMFAAAATAAPDRRRGVHRRRRTQPGAAPASAVAVQAPRPPSAAASRPTPRLLAEQAHSTRTAAGRHHRPQPAAASLR